MSEGKSFGIGYAEAYDLLYRDKPYDLECDIVERILATHGTGGRRILDLGCGTGAHAIRLAGRGYEVIGVDSSEAMLGRARAKMQELAPGGRVEFHHADIRSLDLARTFDAVLMMFAVLSYQLEDEDVLCALGTARRHLAPGGLVLFDVWYGPAVEAERPSERLKVVDLGGEALHRVASGLLDRAQHRCRVEYQLRRVRDGTDVLETTETHCVRYFFPLEIERLLRDTGFEQVHLSAFPQIDREASESSWNVLVVGRALAQGV